MNESGRNESGGSRARHIALGAGIGLVIGGGIDMLTNDTGWGLAIGILAGAVLGYFIKFSLPVMEYPAFIIRRIIISVELFLGMLFLSQWLLGQNIERPYDVIAAVLPAIPGAYLAYSIGMAIAQLDELQRRIQLEAIGIGFGLSVIFALTYALLIPVGVTQVSWMFVPLLMILLWGVGKLWTMWKCR